MHYQAKLEAETDAYQKELEAKGKAAGIRLSGAAEAEAITAKGKAEADAMQRKAEAWKQYTDAGLAEMVIQQLPELARAVSEPLAKVDKIIMVGDASGASKLTGQVASVLAQLPAVVESLTGIKLAEILNRGKKEKANE
jgi:flotillin